MCLETSFVSTPFLHCLTKYIKFEIKNLLVLHNFNKCMKGNVQGKYPCQSKDDENKNKKSDRSKLTGQYVFVFDLTSKSY